VRGLKVSGVDSPTVEVDEQFHTLHKCGSRIVAITSAFHAEDEGSIPFFRSIVLHARRRKNEAISCM
jgi:hypothetical protein